MTEIIDTASYKKVFDELMRPYGGELKISETPLGVPDVQLLNNLLSTGQPLIDSYRFSRQTQPLGKMPHVHLGLVDSWHLQALAFSEDGKDFIGVFHGTCSILQDLFHRMLAHKEVLPHIGDPALEDSSPDTLPYLVNNFEDIGLMTFRKEIRGRAVSNQNERIHYANRLLASALRFLVFHELAHLRNGHVDFINQTFGTRPLNEFGATGSTGLSPLTSQAMEMDADSWAVVQTTVAAFGGFSLDTPGEASLDTPTVRERVNSLADCFFAIHTMFCLLEIGEDPTVPILSLSHPPARRRQTMNAAVILAIFERENQFHSIAHDVADEMVQAMVRAEQALALVVPSRNIPFVRPVVEDATIKDYANTLNNHWTNVVRPLLLPFTRAVDLPA